MREKQRGKSGSTKRRGLRASADVREWAHAADAVDVERVRKLLLSTPTTMPSICMRLGTSERAIRKALGDLVAAGANVQRLGERWSILREPVQVPETQRLHRLRSEAKGRYRFGVISDTHYGSKYAREDVCEDLYDWFAAEGIERVYHGGNWIDGEARFNRMDLVPEAHGMQAQLDLFVERYPQRKGIETHYVAGDDHEGWYAQREGVDIGRMLEDTARRAGRTDLHYLGYMEAFVTLEHARTGNTSKLLVMHPGGGSAYATSYAPQKVAEAFQPGEKPGVAIFGHWHKLEYLNIRGVHAIQAGCTKDLDPFGRKKRLSYHIGGVVVDLWQDEQGGISGCRPHFRQYFDRGYYNGTFDLARVPVKVRAPRGRGWA